MKKLLSIVTALALTISMTGIAVSAHGGHHGRRQYSADVKIVYHCTEDCTYCDDDEDGICDNCGTKGVCSVKPKAKSRHCHH